MPKNNNPKRKSTLANLPLPVFDWLQARKEYSGSSFSYEITCLCRAEMEREAEAAAAKERAAAIIAPEA
jgi:hypothetical protein